VEDVGFELVNPGGAWSSTGKRCQRHPPRPPPPSPRREVGAGEGGEMKQQIISRVSQRYVEIFYIHKRVFKTLLIALPRALVALGRRRA